MSLTPLEELDLHWKDEDCVLGISSEGVLCNNMDDIIERVSKVKDTVKIINLNNQHSLTEIPEVLKKCEHLEELNISHTEITAIPDFLFSLPALRALSCCCKELLQPPAALAKAQKLEKLHIRINKSWDFPEGILSLSKLKILVLDIYSEAAFPKDLGNLKKIEELTFSIKYEHGEVQNLPGSFLNHPALKKFNIIDIIFKNYKVLDFEKTAHILSSCHELESLTLSGFTIKKIDVLSKLVSLKELILRHLMVEGNIFESMTALKNLEKLEILGSEFKITEISDIFGNFNELRSFLFAGNFVRKLPPSLFMLNKLTTLEIGSTGIAVLDEKIGNFKDLINLHFYDNMLEKLPNSVFTLSHLAVLNIEENFLKQQDIVAIKQKLNVMYKNGQKIEFTCGGQGYRIAVKKLRAINYFESINNVVYFRYCMAAVCEKPNALKYIRDDLLRDNEYIQVCLEAALRNSYADFLVNINHKRLKRRDYERICWAAVLHLPSTISKMVEPTDELLAIAAKHSG
jgi:Leucine-rich repeat (LRR) protein